MIFQVLFYTLVVIWTIFTGLIVFILLKHRQTLINTFKMLKSTKNSLSNNPQQFEQIKRTFEELNKISKRLKK
jgi:hypothetical protein